MHYTYCTCYTIVWVIFDDKIFSWLAQPTKITQKFPNYVSGSPSTSLTCLQALLGWLLFGESLNIVWWCGASLVIVGVAVMWEGQRDQEGTEEHKGKKEE